MGYKIAIDGPAGAGKSTVAKTVAEKLDFIYVDTGAMYRAVAWFFLENGIESLEGVNVKVMCAQMDIRISYDDGNQNIILNDKNITEYLRDEKIGRMSSIVAVNGNVRDKLIDLQRYIAGEEDVVMDGRDIGIKVLPDAQLKIFLTASVDVRAKRRYDELVSKGQEMDLEKIRDDIRARDDRDMNRELSPLKKADDAILIDTSNMTIDEAVEKIILIYKNSITVEG